MTEFQKYCDEYSKLAKKKEPTDAFEAAQLMSDIDVSQKKIVQTRDDLKCLRDELIHTELGLNDYVTRLENRYKTIRKIYKRSVLRTFGVVTFVITARLLKHKNCGNATVKNK